MKDGGYNAKEDELCMNVCVSDCMLHVYEVKGKTPFLVQHVPQGTVVRDPRG
jgi:hypothetical protein